MLTVSLPSASRVVVSFEICSLESSPPVVMAMRHRGLRRLDRTRVETSGTVAVDVVLYLRAVDGLAKEVARASATACIDLALQHARATSAYATRTSYSGFFCNSALRTGHCLSRIAGLDFDGVRTERGSGGQREIVVDRTQGEDTASLFW